MTLRRRMRCNMPLTLSGGRRKILVTYCESGLHPQLSAEYDNAEVRQAWTACLEGQMVERLGGVGGKWVRGPVAALVLLSLQAGNSAAENLHRKFGRNWSCKMISAELEELYRACRNCETQGEEFDQTSSSDGQCIPKDSMRETGEPDDLREQRQERERIQAEVNAREREMENERRRQRVRQWLDSDVSGKP